MPVRQLIVRDADDTDQEEIEAVSLAAYTQYKEVMSSDGWKHYTEELLRTLNTQKPCSRLVAELNGKIVGCIQYYDRYVDVYGDKVPRVPWPELRLLAVEPSVRGFGIARAIMEACEQRAAESGADYIGLHTSDAMQAAQNWYIRRGYERFPDNDFSPVEGTWVKAFRLKLHRGGEVL